MKLARMRRRSAGLYSRLRRDVVTGHDVSHMVGMRGAGRQDRTMLETVYAANEVRHFFGAKDDGLLIPLKRASYNDAKRAIDSDPKWASEKTPPRPLCSNHKMGVTVKR